jgi:hypothetical protein
MVNLQRLCVRRPLVKFNALLKNLKKVNAHIILVKWGGAQVDAHIILVYRGGTHFGTF